MVLVLLNTTTRRDINGEIVGFFGVAQDVRFSHRIPHTRVLVRLRSLSLSRARSLSASLCFSLSLSLSLSLPLFFSFSLFLFFSFSLSLALSRALLLARALSLSFLAHSIADTRHTLVSWRTHARVMENTRTYHVEHFWPVAQSNRHISSKIPNPKTSSKIPEP
jgi:hypothetical protein